MYSVFVLRKFKLLQTMPNMLCRCCNILVIFEENKKITWLCNGFSYLKKKFSYLSKVSCKEESVHYKTIRSRGSIPTFQNQ